ncbi:hypothetical protein [Sediminibacterium goheungense]|uniref:ABC transporter ATPase n=1 Tax=Sediminibacterium goheungense TaxID=1086393 RepID=A0A4R6IT28_9BACT|nr:hypothetical protein [Sediminibacterium goheungense]TDO25660.1 hypothetical protein BC659_2582 [Sediminibacterium goheungense]
MELNYQSFIPADFHDSSRVWVYQSSRLFLISEAFEIESMLKEFTGNWLSHGTPVKGYANLLFGQFLVFMADETATGVSGCSTDSSVRVVKMIEERFKVSMFDRQQLAFVVKDKVQLIPLAQFSYALENNFINAETLYFNNLVATKQELMEKWLIPVKQSWLKARMKTIAG